MAHTWIGRLEWFIVYSGSKKDSEAEIFCKIKPFLLDISEYTSVRKTTDIQSKVEELKLLNQYLTNRDKLMDDAISQFLDQLRG